MTTVALFIDDAALRERAALTLAAERIGAVEADSPDPYEAVIVGAAPEPSAELVPLVQRIGRGRLVFLCAEIPRRGVRAVAEIGGGGLVLVDRLEATLGMTMRAVVGGQLCMPIDEFIAARPLLSSREKQILGMVTLGFSNAEIASTLVLSEATIKSHLNSAFRKLGVKGRSEAAHMILDPVQGLGTGILTITDGS